MLDFKIDTQQIIEEIKKMNPPEIKVEVNTDSLKNLLDHYLGEQMKKKVQVVAEKSFMWGYLFGAITFLAVGVAIGRKVERNKGRM